MNLRNNFCVISENGDFIVVFPPPLCLLKNFHPTHFVHYVDLSVSRSESFAEDI